MKRLGVVLLALLLSVTLVSAAGQPAMGDMAFGVKYGELATESQFGDNEGIYGLEWEGWINDNVSFGFGAFRPSDHVDFSGDFFVDYHYKAFFVEGLLSYLNLPEDSGAAGAGIGLSVMATDNVRLKFMAAAQFVLGTINVVRGVEPVPVSSTSTESGCWYDCEEPQQYQPNVEAVDAVYRIEGGVSWVW